MALGMGVDVAVGLGTGVAVGTGVPVGADVDVIVGAAVGDGVPTVHAVNAPKAMSARAKRLWTRCDGDLLNLRLQRKDCGILT